MHRLMLLIISVYVVLAAISLYSCKKNLTINEISSSKEMQYPYGLTNYFYILARDKQSGDVSLFSSTSYQDYFLYSGDILIHKDDLEPIKTYYNLSDNSLKEIELLKGKYKNYASRKLQVYDNTDTLYNIKVGASLWTNNTVFLSVDPALPSEMFMRLTDAIEQWREISNISFELEPWQNNFPLNKIITLVRPTDDKYSCS